MANNKKKIVAYPLGDDEDQAHENQIKNLKEKAGSLNIPRLSELPKHIDSLVLDMIPAETAKEYQIAVFERTEDYLKVAMVNPQNIKALNVLRFLSEKKGVKIKIYSISAELFQDIVQRYESVEETVEDVVKYFRSSEDAKKLASDKKIKGTASETIQGAPVAKLVQTIIHQAIDKKASDIHIEPIRDDYRVRFRIDGVLHLSLVLPKEVGRMAVAHIKILSKLKIDEKRKPQDGRFKIKENDIITDFRISTFPVLEGEKIVIRVLSKNKGTFNLKELGAIGRNKEILVKKLKDTYGIILMTGPTGSGKSTTLYALLQMLNEEKRNIITLEDPVEYFIEGINQSQIKPEIGYTFANGLRSILRQDPNVIMVGEIRDEETAELAIHAALTGHLVFSTLHTNNAIGAISRLVDMGLAPFLLSSSLKALAAQRLVRKICPHCKEEVDIPQSMKEKINRELRGISPEEVKKYGLNLSENMKFYRGKGCEKCGGMGLRGRMAIYEVIEVDEDIQRVISESGNDEVVIEEEVKKQGMISMKQDGLLKVLKGMTTLSEVERMTEGGLTVGGDMEDDAG